jgi:hypothetical protein
MNIDTNSKANPSFEKLEFQANKNFKIENTSSLSCSSDMAPSVMKFYESSRTEPTKYPKCVLLIIFNQFCERFSFCGIRTILFIFLTSKV